MDDEDSKTRTKKADILISNPPSFLLQSKILSRADGMALVGVLALLPALLLLSFGFFIIGSQSLRQSRTLHFCRQEGLKVQHNTAKSLESLLHLNPIASRLRLQRKASRIALKTALATGSPQNIAAARLVDQIVAFQQRQLQSRQYYLVTKMKTQLLKGFRRLKKGLSQLGAQNLKGIPPQVQLLKKPSQSITPNYLVPLSFADRAKLEWKWQTNKDPEIIATKSPHLERFSLKGACATSLKKGSQKWIASLIAVK
ncbi:MAG: hypothetical protein KDD35_08740 [Bdellovibrionales bacterium]|nr:hypothetical protein [Bdellovibrionales bacterium]